MNGKKHRQNSRQNKRQKYKAVLFDKDGVLLDSFNTVFKGVNEARKHYGLSPLTKQEFIDQCWGKRATVEMNVFGASSESELDERHSYYRKKRMELEYNTMLYPDTIEVLDALHGKVKMGLITSTFRDVVTKIIADFGLAKYFEVVVAGDDTVKPKPAPDPVLKACELLGVKPQETIFVGDTIPDIQAGLAAGCQMVFVTTTLNSEQLKNVGGIEDVIIIENLKGLLEIL